MDFTDKTVDELVELRDEVSAEIKSKREAARTSAKADAEARETAARGADLNEGDKVAFLFNRERVEDGKILKVSDKTVTIESEVFSKGKGYRKYSEILIDTEEAVDEDEVTEEVAE